MVSPLMCEELAGWLSSARVDEVLGVDLLMVLRLPALVAGLDLGGTGADCVELAGCFRVDLGKAGPAGVHNE